MEKRRFLINLLSNFLGAVSGLGLSFFLTPYLVQTLGKEAYGFFPLASNFLLYTGILTTALNSMSGRYITIALEKRRINEVNTYFTSVFFGNLLFAVFFLCLSVLFCMSMGYFLDIPNVLLFDVRLLFVCTFINLIIGLVSTVFTLAPFALNRFDIMALNNIVANIIKLIVTLLLFYFFNPHIYFLGLVTICTSIYLLVAGYRNTKKLLPEVRISRTFFSWRALTVLMGAGAWNAVIALSNTINTQLDLIIANKFFTATGMGLLSLTKFVPLSVQVLLGIVVPIFLPDMLKAYANQDFDKMKLNLNFSFKVIFLVVMTPLAVFFVYGEEFYKLWLPDEDHHKLYVLSVLTLVPIVVHASIETVYHVFVITNKLRIASYWGIMIAMVNFLLVMGLCRYGIMGIYAIPIAALVTGLFSHLIFTPLYAAYCLQEKSIYFLLKLGKNLMAFIGLVIVGFVWKFSALIHTDTWPAFLWNVLIAGTAVFVLALAINMDKQSFLYFKNKWTKKHQL